jgi:hypothetical protein
LQGPPKFTQIGIFGLQNMPSGNPTLNDARTQKWKGWEEKKMNAVSTFQR